jgi:hypothetical protein
MTMKLTLSPKLPIGIAFLMAFSITGCTTVENRRDLYSPQIVEGPYTRLLHHGLPTPTPQQIKVNPAASHQGSSGKAVIKPQG